MFYVQGPDLELAQVLETPHLHPAEDELLQTYGSFKITSEWAHNIDTTQTSFSPQSFDNDAISSNAISFYTPSLFNGMSSNNARLHIPDFENDSSLAFGEQFLDLNTLPGVLEDITSYKENVNKNINTHNKTPFIMCQEDAMDFNYPVFVEPQEIENNTIAHGLAENKQKKNFILNIPTPGSNWYNDVLNTQEVLDLVTQLETDNLLLSAVEPGMIHVPDHTPIDRCAPALPLLPDGIPATRKSELNDSTSDVKPFFSRKRHCSEDSDEIYIPHQERTSMRKYKRHKPHVLKKEIISAFQSPEPTTKVRKGRPPKRKQSVVSACSVDESMSSVSTEDYEYRVLRDKNNEASRRSRMNKKQKDLETEKLAIVLEKTNSTLKAKVTTLEELAKKMRKFFKTLVLST